MMSNEELWERTARALDRGDFTLLDELLIEYNASIIDLLDANGSLVDAMNEAFTWACFTNRTDEAEALLNKSVDPTAGDKTGLSGFHWAASRGNVETVRMLIRRKAPLEQVNMYGGTVFGQTLWSAVNEAHDGQAEVIEMLIKAGAQIEPDTLEWWKEQNVTSAETKTRVATALREA